jgi:hypothetical protein
MTKVRIELPEDSVSRGKAARVGRRVYSELLNRGVDVESVTVSESTTAVPLFMCDGVEGVESWLGDFILVLLESEEVEETMIPLSNIDSPEANPLEEMGWNLLRKVKPSMDGYYLCLFYDNETGTIRAGSFVYDCDYDYFLVAEYGGYQLLAWQEIPTKLGMLEKSISESLS